MVLLPSAGRTENEKKASAVALQYHMIIPTVEPYMIVAKLGLVSRDGKFSKVLSEAASAAKLYAAHTPDMGGYKDGSIRVWDATYPVLSLIYLLGAEVNGINIAGTSASISALDFCSETSSLAIGNEYGLVLLYKLMRSLDDTILHFVTETENEGLAYCTQLCLCIPFNCQVG
ncbi:hypothetical protein CIPAW_16G023500 [Carya illinoinensis]|uniref:Uncharacterized protein n=1 Tax=Carya illinoinensis TaxID=32201 RepID=A0A8T1N2X4_CARIL|nr:hypothetical protein CIPAW_16G023500 [Carya illinoinensis]